MQAEQEQQDQKDGRVALVTGGNRGIGKEICRRLAREGLRVVLTAREKSRGIAAQEILKKEGLEVEFQRLDLLDPASIEAAVAFVASRYGKLDFLVNNAGILPDRNESGVTVSEGMVREAFETNALGPLLVSQAFAPLLKKGWHPKIINVSSGLGSLSDMSGGYPAYRISKTALNAVTRILAAELKASGIYVNSICPGWVKSDMGGKYAERTVGEGAMWIVRLALMDKDIPSGAFLRDGKPIPW